MNPLPTTPAELATQLSAVFPDLRVKREPNDDSPETFHSVLLFRFNSFFRNFVEAGNTTRVKIFTRVIGGAKTYKIVGKEIAK